MKSDHENHREEGVRKLPETAGTTPRNDGLREGQDGPDGRPSPLANADNPQR